MVPYASGDDEQRLSRGWTSGFVKADRLTLSSEIDVKRRESTGVAA
jgi:hypothetical protein